MVTRRDFLLRTSAMASLAPLAPTMLCRAARAAGAEADARTLVVIQLDGGNDGLNTVVPYADDGYARARTRLRLETDKLHKLNDYLALHPQMKGAKELFDDGRLTIVQGVGYPNPDRSHFRSMKIWQTASFDDAAHDGYGWLGRALDDGARRSQVAAEGESSAFFVGDDQPPVALWGRQSTTTTLSRIEDLTLEARPASAAALEEPAHLTTDVRDFVSRQVAASYAAAERFKREQARDQAEGAGKYPETSLARRLQLVSRLLKSGAQARVYYTVQSGYDTHAAQQYTHAQLLSEFSGALKAFLDDLKASRLEERVVVLAFSEFGRRVKENASQGTDHGAAGPLFLAGRPLAGGILGANPNLADLDAGDLKATTDFRQVYATLLEQWLSIRPTEILSDDFGQLALF